MGNILDYIEQEKQSFTQYPFCAVDSLVLSQLSYLNFDGLVPGPGEGDSILLSQLANEKTVAAMVKGIRAPDLNTKLFWLLAESPRFQNLRLSAYINHIDEEKEEQFSAVTFLLGEDAYVAFRGTDAYYVAWKEDFNLAFICPVPSQVEAAEYLSHTAVPVSGRLLVGGHSKGGNLAVYASLFCTPEAQRKVDAVFSHDGPGFQPEVLETPEYLRMKERIHKTIPQSSLVGVLLQHQESYQVIRSDSFWIMQHDPFSWVVENGSFSYEASLTSSAAFLNRSLNEWISALSEEELSAFVDALYKVLCSFGGETFADMPEEWWKIVLNVLGGMKELDADTYKCILFTVRSLVSLAIGNLPKPKVNLKLPELALPSIPLPKRLPHPFRKHSAKISSPHKIQ